MCVCSMLVTAVVIFHIELTLMATHLSTSCQPDQKKALDMVCVSVFVSLWVFIYFTHVFSDFFSTQSLQWSGRDSLRDGPAQRFPPAAMTKCHLSRSKKKQPPASMDHIATDSITSSKDHVIFAESPVAPGVPVVYRPPEERAANPDRLNLDRRHLTVFPILEGEERLRLLNLQHNAITRLQHLSSLRKLVFLDLYDNLIHEISNLEGLLSLRVLMLGKNRCVCV